MTTFGLILAVSPDGFTNSATAWIAAVSAVLVAATSAAAFILPKLATLNEQIESLKRSRDVARTDIQATQQAITQIALKTPVVTVTSPVVQTPEGGSQ